MTAKQSHRFQIGRLETPIGTALLVTDDQGFLRALDWSDYETRLHRLLRRHYGDYVLEKAQAPANITAALTRYFAGDLGELKTIKWRTNGTPFQRKVWAELQKIRAGKTSSYGAFAARLNVPNAARAVGLANGSNPVSVVVPCHRLIGADGSLTGYGGGLARKEWLLAHEGAALRKRARI
ncbi:MULTISPECIES: methylated-DNA--[protein]-cysteine S-methyltransferase [unclassified Afipia]|uniref:methylated-DNA--[protein]-cysteine S-methyltransferase n=1 Tax=unclassified Afipia TaxID=2642050 RepID=UPI0003F4D5E3|nr:MULTISPECIES: methylated-DNA--[protein]-cysteine S-methyltransferase [unclassified Afipia]